MPKELMTGNEAAAHAALESGVRVCAGYPGTPSSEVIETIARAHASGVAEGVHVEWSTNEKAALELLAGASYAGARGLYTCKQVGLNVASDALMSLNYVGVGGGLVLYVADDPGPISSQTEQDTRRFASFAKLPVLDPASPEQACEMMQAAFELSERYATPVILRPTTRICHASTYVTIAEKTQARDAAGFEKDPRWVIFPKRSCEAHGEINERLVAIADEFSGEAWERFNAIDGDRDAGIGIVAGGVSYAYVREALAILADEAARGLLADEAGAAVDRLPSHRLMQIGTAYPFPAARVESFAQGAEDLIVFEELDHVIEDELLKVAGRAHLPYRVHGKLTGETIDRGENSIDIVVDELLSFFGFVRRPEAAAVSFDLEGLPAAPPARPPLLCPGCPHRGAFYAVKSAFRRPASEAVFCGDIGCYTLGNAKPLNAVDTCLCMGAGITVAQGLSVADPEKKAVAFVGDSTFFASGMTGIANAVYNRHDVTIVVLDNATTAMTGSQPHPGTGATLMGPQTEPISIEAVLRALGVKKITQADPLCLPEAREAAREAIYFDGPSAVIFVSPCVKLIAPSEPVSLDEESCTGCARCVLSIGCPALSWDADERRVRIDRALCTGCGLCVDLCDDGALSCPSRGKEPR